MRASAVSIGRALREFARDPEAHQWSSAQSNRLRLGGGAREVRVAVLAEKQLAKELGLQRRVGHGRSIGRALREFARDPQAH
jgi:hypothetical protein